MADHSTASAIIRVMLCLAVSLSVGVAYAGDEDMSPNAYQQFDPVTGYMVPVDDPNASQQGHGESAADTVAGDAAELSGDGSVNAVQPGLWLSLLAAAVVLAAFVAWVRNKSTAGSKHIY